MQLVLILPMTTLQFTEELDRIHPSYNYKDTWAQRQVALIYPGKVYKVRTQFDDIWLQVYAWHKDGHFGMWPIKYLEFVYDN